ncbi:MAG: hypothetical protein NTY23_15690 [Chloroflexi bacterium]|nr:hypothetical protein [Chloroflexota bacterium]
MRALALDADGDLALTSVRGGLRLTLVEGPEAIAQRIRGRIRLWLGDWFLDTSIGVPYLQILGQKNAAAFAEATLRRVILTTPGVAGLDTFSFALTADRSATVAFRARSTDGAVVEDGGFRVGTTTGATQ